MVLKLQSLFTLPFPLFIYVLCYFNSPLSSFLFSPQPLVHHLFALSTPFISSFPLFPLSSFIFFALIFSHLLELRHLFFSCCFLCSFCSTSIPSSGCRSSQKVYSSQSTEMSSMQTRQHLTLIKMGGQIQKSAKSLMIPCFMFPILKPSLVKTVHSEFSYTESMLNCLLKSICLSPALTCQRSSFFSCIFEDHTKYSEKYKVAIYCLAGR